MARARLLKPSFFTNDTLAELPPLTRLLFQGLWCLSDREGRLQDRPRRIKAELLPYDDVDVDAMLSDLAAQGFVIRYESGGIRYLQVTNFVKHQTPHIKEPPSTIPAPDEHSASTVQASEIQETSTASRAHSPIPHSPNQIPIPEAERESVRANGTNGHGRPPPRLVPIPQPWEWSDDVEEWIKEHKLSWPWARAHTEVFLDHYLSLGDTGRVLNSPEGWQAAWRKWLLKDLNAEQSKVARR